jgi:hypothetical protein
VIPAIRSAPHSSLVAVASRDIERAQKYAAEWDIPLAFGSYSEMLDSDQVDAVYNPLPNDQHVTWTIRALQAGKHVLCEKPFALSVEEVDRMENAAKSSGKILTEAFMYLHHPQTDLVLRTMRVSDQLCPKTIWFTNRSAGMAASFSRWGRPDFHRPNALSWRPACSILLLI